MIRCGTCNRSSPGATSRVTKAPRCPLETSRTSTRLRIPSASAQDAKDEEDAQEVDEQHHDEQHASSHTTGTTAIRG